MISPSVTISAFFALAPRSPNTARRASRFDRSRRTRSKRQRGDSPFSTSSL